MFLQASSVCDPSIAPTDYLTNFEFIKAFTCTYADTIGLLVTGLFVFGAVGLATYIRTDSVVIPTVLVLVAGGAILPLVAGPGTGFALLLVLVIGGGAAAFLYLQLSR